MTKLKKYRCEWVGSDPRMIRYHDQEWGVPVHNDRELFEFLVLEGAQAGLSWSTILNRRDGYRKAFSDFNVNKVASYTESDFNRLTQDPSIIRNKLKIKSAINNAQKFIAVQNEFGSFNDYIWKFVNFKPVHNHFEKLSDIPATTDLSRKISKDLKRRGFAFIGPTICYAFIQSIGIVNDHLISCFRFNEIFNMTPSNN